jgi:hypothetical protein
MKIIIEADVMESTSEGKYTPSMYSPGHCSVRVRVTLAGESVAQEFEQVVVLRQERIESTFDFLMKDLTRNMKELLVSHLEGRGFLEKFALMPVLGFRQVGGR